MPPTPPPPRSTPPPAGPVPDADLAALAAGLFDPAEAAALEVRATRDAALSTRVAAARADETRLHGDDLFALPRSFVAAVVAAVRATPRAPWERPLAPGLALPRWARAIAAALLVATGGALTLFGIEPVAATADTVAAVTPTPPVAWLTARAPAPWTQGPAVGARTAAASIAAEAGSLPGGPAGLLVAGAGLLVAALAASRLLAAGRAPRPGPTGETPR